MNEGADWLADMGILLADEGYGVIAVAGLDAVRPHLQAAAVKAVLVAARPLGASDLLLLRGFRQASPATSIVVVARTATQPDLKRAFESGATAFLSWPAATEAVRHAIEGPAKEPDMKIEATADQIRALLRFAELNAQAEHPITGSRASHGVPRLLLERYSTLRDRGRSPEVVAIDRGACSGCHVRLPTMLEYEAGRSLALYTCPHCRRLLYSSELLGIESGAAAPKAQRQEPTRAARSRS